ncbi:hypothetical protein BJ508DRAFT_412047 [Ascobolus immersus RN42]|uniref:Uncharacterized protein n=1 Tax=Ascobolus immersus RN42 TaxID=1160509 RepID=A0A3N4IM95_ASCIM|nr:hypothetical protein BJ508DRAFT_412047 [Ascobolus immersus RN42]
MAPSTTTSSTAASLTPVQALLKYLRRKRYQYEVTFSLYMLTPIEKIIFNIAVFLFFSMIIVATSLYFPTHFKVMASRVWFYIAGDDSLVKENGGMFMDEVKPEL